LIIKSNDLETRKEKENSWVDLIAFNEKKICLETACTERYTLNYSLRYLLVIPSVRYWWRLKPKSTAACAIITQFKTKCAVRFQDHYEDSCPQRSEEA
jgi:hypothetical protein